MSTIKAFVNSASEPFHMDMNPSYPKPSSPTNATTVLVKVKAVSLNPVDYKLPKQPVVGRFMRGSPMGLDFSGVIAEVGPGQQVFKVGDEVFGTHRGSLCEYILASTKTLTIKPANASFVQAAALPVAAVTSLQALKIGKIKAGARVLVIGASGGCGSLGVQIAKQLGASHITGICSTANAGMVRGLGADAVHPYDSPEGAVPKIPASKLEEEGFDVIYDAVTSPEDHDYTTEAKPLLRANGMYVQINGSGSMFLKMILGKITYGYLDVLPANHRLFLADVNSKELDEIAALVQKGALQILVEQTYPFEESAVREAFTRLSSRRAKGKLVIDFDKQ